MSIDIDPLTEAELVDLNRRIVERLRFLHQMRAHATMLKFSIGDRVCFDTDDFRKITGTLVRYNKIECHGGYRRRPPLECLAQFPAPCGTQRHHPGH